MNDAVLFYKSFYDGIEMLPESEQLKAYNAIMRYALFGEEPENLGLASICFVMAKPQIDANAKRRESGKAGGEAKKANRSKCEANGSKCEANGSKPEANESTASDDDVANPSTATQNDVALLHEDSSTATNGDLAQLDKYKEKEKEKDKENYKEKAKLKERKIQREESDALNERSFSDDVKEALSDWLQYKREKGQSYKPTGLKQLFDGIETEINNQGEPAVIEGIRNSMQNNWQGIFYPRPQPQEFKPFDADAYLRERMMTG